MEGERTLGPRLARWLTHDVLQIVRQYRSAASESESICAQAPGPAQPRSLAKILSGRESPSVFAEAARGRSLVLSIAAADVAGDRSALLWLLFYHAGLAKAILSGLGNTASAEGTRPVRADLRAFRAFQDLQVSDPHLRVAGAESLIALEHDTILDDARRTQINRVVRTLVESETDARVRRRLLAMLSSSGRSREDRTVILGAWRRESDPETWHRLLQAIERLGHDDLQTAKALHSVYRSGARRETQLWHLWSTLCRQAPKDFQRRVLNLESRVNSIGIVMRRLSETLPESGSEESRGQTFWVADFPVTSEQWRCVMSSHDPSFDEYLAGRQDLPVVSITWHEAAAYCEILSKVESERDLIPSGSRYRLPLESEWEYVASGGQNRSFWYGLDVMPSLIASAGASSPAAPRPRSQAIANQFGVFDTLGNVWEWCANDVEDNGGPSDVDPKSGQKVIRGGGGFTAPEECTCQLRKAWWADGAIPILGFRIALELAGECSPAETEDDSAK